MGLTIRMRKPGKSAKQRRHNKIVIIDKSAAREGKFLEEIGYYDPTSKMLKMDTARYDYWVEKGALPSDTVKGLYTRTKKATK